MSKINIKKIHDVDLINKITILSKIVNDEDSDVKEVKNAINEMRTIVNHAGLIFQTTQDIFNKTFKTLSTKIEKLNEEIHDDEYSTTRIDFLHKMYELKVDDHFDSLTKAEEIKITDNLSIPQRSWLQFKNPDTICLYLGKTIVMSTTLTNIKQLSFNYSPDILKPLHKKYRHIAPLQSLYMDLKRLENNPELFKIEQNKIKSHIIYNILLYLLLDSRQN